MELVGQDRKQSPITIVSIQLPWYVWIALVALTSITIVVIGVIMASRREVSNPFSAFNDLFGDDGRQAALARGFTCRGSSFSGLPLTDHCAQRDTDGIFSGISMRMSGNVADEISFSLRENAPTLGDLVLL